MVCPGCGSAQRRSPGARPRRPAQRASSGARDDGAEAGRAGLSAATGRNPRCARVQVHRRRTVGSAPGTTASAGRRRRGSVFQRHGRDQAAFLASRVPSFTHFLSSYDPGLLPDGRRRPCRAAADAAYDVIKDLPHATTIVAVTCERGVVMAGDRRATAGNMIAKRDVAEGVPRPTSTRASASPAWPASAWSSSGCSRRARALREDGGPHPLPRGQGQPAGQDDPRQPHGARCRAWR